MDGSDRAEDGTAAAYPAGHQTAREFRAARYQMIGNVLAKATSITGLPNDGAEDSPAISLLPKRGEEARSFSAIMYLMWRPPMLGGCNNGDSCTIPVPLGYFQWSLWGDAINTLQPELEPPACVPQKISPF